MVSLAEKTLLVVDDEPLIRTVVADNIANTGARVLKADGGLKALEILRQKRIDAVISDIRMPGGNGIDLLKVVKTLNPESPVVVLVSGTPDLSVEEAYDYGAAGLFMKPFNLPEVLTTVHQALLPHTERWSKKSDPIPSDLFIHPEPGDLVTAIAVGEIDVGQGGMFVELNGPLPAPGSRVAFQEGVGTCRWRRDVAEEGLLKGIGIEFLDLSEKLAVAVSATLQRLRPAAYIPRGVDSRT